MDFQIERLIIWPKKEGLDPKEVEFKKNCVNVLSGDSRTGKSAVVSIIDYCLGSHDFSVPGGKVRENASWFGLVVIIGEDRLLLARRNPDGQKKGTGDFFQKTLNTDEKVPSKIEEKNTDIETVVGMLSQLIGLEPIRREDYGAENAKLSFRDICHLLFQPQDVVASRLQMFDKMNIYHSKEKLANWFNFVLGVETVQDILDKVELEKIRRALEAIGRERERDANKLGEWINKLRGELMSARNYGLISDDVIIPDVEDKKALLSLAEETVQNSKKSKPPKSEWAINREIKKLENLYSEACAKHSRAEKRVGTLEDLTESIAKAGRSNIEKRDRLQISKWIIANWKPAKICPVCGGTSHPAASVEIEKICQIVEEVEKVKNNIDEFPAATQNELIKRRAEAEAARKRAEDIYEQLNAVKEQKVEIGNFLEEEKKKASILEGLKRTLELNTATIGGTRLDVEEAQLKAQKEQITKRYNQYAIKAKAEQAYQEICHITHERFCSMDSEDIYQQNPPLFDSRDLTIILVDQNNQKYSLHEVGSASNWVASHVAFTCALQEFSASRKQSCIPRFVVYDQPSQVYFPAPKLAGKISEAEIAEVELKADDIQNVKMIFQALADSCNGKWQAIVLDHAGINVYGDIPSIHILKEWRNGEALIPRKWYEEKES